MAKFISFEIESQSHSGKPVWSIKNKKSGAYIGQVFWYQPWRQYTCRFKEDSVWSHDCLEDIRKFILEVKV